VQAAPFIPQAAMVWVCGRVWRQSRVSQSKRSQRLAAGQVDTCDRHGKRAGAPLSLSLWSDPSPITTKRRDAQL